MKQGSVKPQTPYDKYIQCGIALVLLCNIVFWFSVRDIKAQWNNVPPPPSTVYAAAYGLGDKSFAYRVNGLMLQNLGDTGGRVTSLKDYDYDRLSAWFLLQDHLDPHSDFIPYLASYYFGGVQEPEKYRPVLDYLEMIGQRPTGEQWRWLAHAVWFARFQMKDMDRALELAQSLAKTKDPTAPAWARQMPAFVLNAQGNKDEAYGLLLEILKSSVDTMHPAEVNSMKIYICTRVLDEGAAAKNPLCQDIDK